MALTTPIAIAVELPIGMSFGNAMNEVRSWLDSKKIEPASFKPVTRHDGIGFEISFRSSREAELFQQTFVKIKIYSASVTPPVIGQTGAFYLHRNGRQLT